MHVIVAPEMHRTAHDERSVLCITHDRALAENYARNHRHRGGRARIFERDVKAAGCIVTLYVAVDFGHMEG
ncbi:MAG TPA: hypothetical protein VIY27_09255 [Myxococcota bacterium]